MNLSIVIPAKNEEKRIKRTLKEYGSYFAARKRNLETELLIVVNNTNDATREVVKKHVTKFPFIRVVETPYASGKGGAVSLGFVSALGEYISYVDADGSVSPEEVYRLYTFLKDTPNLDGVIGNREKALMTIRRKILSTAFNILVKTLFGLDYSDTQCAVKIFKKNVAKSLASRLSNTGWAFDVNLLLLARRFNYLIKEKTIVWQERKGSKFSAVDGLLFAPLELLELKLFEIVDRVKILTRRYQSHKRKVSGDSGRLNILIFAYQDIKSSTMGGAEIYLQQIAKRLAKHHKVTIFTSASPDLSDNDEIDHVSIIRRGKGFGVFLYAILYYFLYFRHDTDLIIDTEKGIPFFTPLFSGKPKLLVVHHIHRSMWFRQFILPIAVVGYFLETVLMPIIYRGVSVITVSPSSLEDLRRVGFDDRKIFIAFNAVESAIRCRIGKSRKPLLLYLGRLKEYKRVDIALRAVKKLKRAFSGLKLVVAGTGDYEKKLKVLIEKMGLSKEVEILGFVSEKQKSELMSKAWVFLMPSSVEGWGITIIEAGMCRTPSVGFDVLGVRNSIQDGETGILAQDEVSFVNSVGFLLDNAGFRKNLGENSRIWAKRFSWDKSVKVFDEVIKFVLLEESSEFISNKVYPWELASRLYAL